MLLSDQAPPPDQLPQAAVPLRRSRASALAFTAYVVIAFCFVLPGNPADWRTRIPDQSGDNLLNLWILRWGEHHIFSWTSLWNAPIYWPKHGALAYSDSMLPVAVVHGLLAHVMGDVLAFNVMVVAAAVTSMFATYLLARAVVGSSSGAFVAGLVYTIASPRIAQYGHFQLAWGCLVPVVLLLMYRFFARPTVGRALAFGITTGILFLSVAYYAAMTLVAIVVILPLLISYVPREQRRAIVRGLVIAAAAALVLAAPVAAMYASVHANAHLAREPNPYLSARGSDFDRVAEGNWVLSLVPPFAAASRASSASVENRLFPGIIATIFGAIGFVVLIRRRRSERRARQRGTNMLWACLMAAIVLLVLSFGTNATVGARTINLPFHLLESFPGFSELRAPARLIAFPLLVAALLAALGVARVLELVKSRRLRDGSFALIVAVLLIESATSITMARVPASSSADAAVNHALVSQPRGAAVDLPMITERDGGGIWAAVETRRMWLAGVDGHPRVDGYSGYQPNGFDAFGTTLNQGSSPAVAALARTGVRYVVLHVTDAATDDLALKKGAFTDRAARAWMAALPGSARVIGHYGNAWLIDLGEAEKTAKKPSISS
jgi:hypothetical protein